MKPARAALSVLFLGVLLGVACGGVACGAARRGQGGVADNGKAPAPPAGAVTAQVAASEIVVGQNRFVLGLLDAAGKPIADASAHLTFFYLSGPQWLAKGEADAAFEAPGREAGLAETVAVTLPDGRRRIQTNAPPDVGVYVAQVAFDRAGDWGVQAQGTLKGGAPYVARAGFHVAQSAATPAIGSPAPASHNLTAKDVTDLSQIDSSAQPSLDMHTESIADGLAAGHPLLVLFASPGYCTSRFCGPELELARKLEQEYRGRVDFIHVEVYKDPSQRVPVDAVDEWHLPSEPWFFLVDARGIVRAKFEGPTDSKELEAALQQIAG